MTVLGFQLVTTMIGACVLSKLVSYFSFARYVYRGLSRYVVPSDIQLLEVYGNCKLKSRIKRRRADPVLRPSGGSSNHDVFYFPRTLSIQLQSTKVVYSEVIALPLYSTFQWLLDFSLCALGIYAITECTYSVIIPWFYPSAQSANSVPRISLTTLVSLSDRFNLSLVWLTLSAWFSVSTLISITGLYFHSSSNLDSTVNSSVAKNSPTREWFLIFAAAFFHLVLSGFALSLDGRYFEFGFHDAYTNLTLGTPFSSDMPLISWGMFHLLIASGAAFIGALFVYPGMKFGKVYVDAMKKQSFRPHQRLLFHLTFIAPLTPSLLWVKPLTNQLSRFLLRLSFSSLAGQYPTLNLLFSITSDLFSVHLHTFRLLACVFVVVLRFGITRWILQLYLDSAQDRLDQFTREPGRTSNKEVQRTVASIFYCLNLVSLQWLAPTVLLLVIICLHKNSAGITWLPVSINHAVPNARTFDPQSLPVFGFYNHSDDSWFNAFVHARSSFLQSSGVIGLRGAVVLESVLGFFSWWCLISLQSVSMLGLAYHRFTSE